MESPKTIMAKRAWVPRIAKVRMGEVDDMMAWKATDNVEREYGMQYYEGQDKCESCRNKFYGER